MQALNNKISPSFYQNHDFFEQADWLSIEGRLSPEIKQLLGKEEHFFAQSIARQNVDQSRVLDFGSGTGRITQAMLSVAPDIEYYSVDINQDSVDYCSLLFELEANVFCSVQDALATDFPDHYFDSIIMSFNFLGILAQHDALFAELTRIVKPGGCLLGSVYHSSALYAQLDCYGNYLKADNLEWDDQQVSFTLDGGHRFSSARFSALGLSSLFNRYQFNGSIRREDIMLFYKMRTL